MEKADARIGAQLGKYKVTTRLGQGGMGVVYEAEDTILRRQVAVKLLPEAVAAQADALSRFLQEARAAARLNHPNVVAVHDIAEQDQTHFIVMELMSGGSAQDFLDAQGPFDWSEATRIIADVCRGLQAAHRAELIHRDIKPANIMRGDDGVIKLADFGLAKVTSQSATAPVTQFGFVVGTPDFMSPEQCSSDPLDERSDIYSLGATYYALLTGKPPYSGDGPIQVMFAHCSASVPNVRNDNPNIPGECAAIVQRAMTKTRSQRFASAAEMLDALEAVLTRTSPSGRAQSKWHNILPQEPEQGSQAVLAHLAQPQQPDELGRLGPYRILRVLGEGDLGVVFQAEDPVLGLLVALKVMKPCRAVPDEARLRFLQEARAAGSMQHEHLVSVYQVGEERDMPYVAMQLLQGEPLDVRLKREGRLPVGSALGIAREIAAGLAAAHNHNLIHRDIKPANIWLEEAGAGRPERAKILDFGLAHLQRDGAQHLTRTDMVIGTPGYMAPEQARTGQPLDGRCDLFSLGCVLYHMLTGQEPFRRADALTTLLALTLEEPPSIRQLNPEVPLGLVRLVSGLLAKSPDKRPRSAIQAIDLLQELEREWQMRGRRKESPALPSADLARPAAEMLAGFGVSPTEIISTASARSGSAFLEVPKCPSNVEAQSSQPAAEPKPAAPGTMNCPRCGAQGINPAGRAWCVACGYYPEPERKVAVRGRSFGWLWKPLIVTVVAILLSYAAWVYLPRIGFHLNMGRQNRPAPPARR